MKKLVLLIVLSLILLVSCNDSPIEPVQNEKIYGVVLDGNGNPLADAEVCVIPDVPDGIRSSKIGGIIDQAPSKILVFELAYLDVESYSDFIKVKWATSNEMNCDKFVVQRAVYNNTWSVYDSIGSVKAKGNSITKTDYSINDSSAQVGKQYAYRLLAYDKDGSSYVTNSVIISYFLQKVGLSQNAPNPFYNYTFFSCDIVNNAIAKFKITEQTTGKDWLIAEYNVQRGRNIFEWAPFSEANNPKSRILRPGVYKTSLTLEETTLNQKIILDFNFKESKCEIPLEVVRTDKNGRFELDWKWFPDLEEFSRISENGSILYKFFYGGSGEIIVRKLISESANQAEYWIARHSVSVDKTEILEINLSAKQVSVQR